MFRGIFKLKKYFLVRKLCRKTVIMNRLAVYSYLTWYTHVNTIEVARCSQDLCQKTKVSVHIKCIVVRDKDRGKLV